MLITQKEYLNFVFYTFRNIKEIPNAIKFFLKIGITKVKKKLNKQPITNYPQRALRITEFSKRYELENHTPHKSPFPGIPFNFTTSLINHKTGKDFKWTDFDELRNSDQEIIISINRWYWLIYDQDQLSAIDPQIIYELAKYWITNNPYTNNLAWESYSTSERISSFCISLLLKQNIEQIKESVYDDLSLLNFFKQSIYHLVNNLEYYPDGVTFNHVLNDLKGIIIASIILGDNELLNVSANLFFDELTLIIDKDGFNREGSSHYQLIITRWICELEFILIAANKLDLVDKVRSYRERMLDKVSFFLINSGSKIIMPLFGDVSPDFDPEWIKSYFSYIFSNTDDQPGQPNYGHIILKKIGVKLIKNDNCSFNEFTRINKGKWVLFVKHSPNAGSFFPNHAHEDYGSYVIFCNGVEIVSDPGRESYVVPANINEYCMPKAHNILLLNGLPASLSSNHYYLTSAYKKATYDKTVLINEQEVLLEVYTNAIHRIGNGKSESYKRLFSINNDYIKVFDNVGGSGTPTLSSQITLGIDVRIINKGLSHYLLKANNEVNINLHLDSISNVVEKADFSDKYGSVLTTNKISFDIDSNCFLAQYFVI